MNVAPFGRECVGEVNACASLTTKVSYLSHVRWVWGRETVGLLDIDIIVTHNQRRSTIYNHPKSHKYWLPGKSR